MVFVGVGVRRDGRCVSKRAVGGGEARRRRYTCQRLGVTQYYSFLLPTKPGRRRNKAVVQADAKREVGTNIKEVKLIDDK